MGRLPMRISHNMRKTHKEATKHRWKHGEYVDRHRERGRETLLSRVAIYVKDRLPPSAGRRRRALSPLSLAKLDTDGPTSSSVRPSSVPQKGRFTSTHSLTHGLTLHRGRLAAEEEGRPPGGGRINSAKRQPDPLLSLRPTGARRPRSTTWMPLLFPSPLAAWLQN